MENSIEDTIKTIEKMIKSYREADECGLSNNDFKNEIKALEHILSDYKRLLKENEKLKNKLLDTLEGQKVIEEETPQYIKENYIPIQKIKDKIEGLKIDELNDKIQVLQELQELLERKNND